MMDDDKQELEEKVAYDDPDAFKLASVSLRVSLVGGARIFRRLLQFYLEREGIEVIYSAGSEEGFQAKVLPQENTGQVLLLTLSHEGPFQTFNYIQEFISQNKLNLPVVVLSDRISRGQVYSALRGGAKGYLSLEVDLNDLITAVEHAASGRVYLSSEISELLANDISSSGVSGTVRLSASKLSHRENQIVEMLCQGFSSKEIARQLHLSPKTIENHRYNIYRKCEVQNIAELIRHAVQQGMVSM